MKKWSYVLAVVTGVATMLAGSEVSHAQIRGFGGCDVGRISWASSDTLVILSPPPLPWVAIPDMHVFVNVKGKCLLASFSAKGARNIPVKIDVLRIRAVMDDTLEAKPGVVNFFENAQDTVRSFNFIFPLVEPGLHTVKMQVISGIGEGAEFSLADRTLVVHYK